MNSVNDQERNASLLIFYDWEVDLCIDAWIELAFSFFDRIGIEPNSSSYLRSDGKSSIVKPKNLRSVVEKYIIQGACLSTLHPPHDDQNSYIAACEFFSSRKDRRRNASFCCPCSDIDIDLFIGLTQDFIKIVGPTYGIGLQFPFERGPAHFASDMLVFRPRERETYEDRQERQFMQIWIKERLDYQDSNTISFRHKDGMLRDVFRYNILTTKHVARIVEGITLREWIGKSAARGLLKEISKDCWIWTVQNKELPAIRETLKFSGALIVRPKGDA